jgi:Flp pilus assembly protein TadG
MTLQTRVIQNFITSEKGTVAPLFGLMIMVMLILMGISIDSARGTRAASIASAALDAAALSAAKALRLTNPTDEELTLLVQDYFKTNFAESEASVLLSSIVVVPDRVLNGVRLVANLKVPTTITALLGVEHLDVQVRSEAVFDVKDVEVSMMLDVSGSMIGSKIADLRAAAKDLVDIMLPEGVVNENKVAIAPFSTAVNAGALANAVTDVSARSWRRAGNTCVTERSGSTAFTDDGPAVSWIRQATATCPNSGVVPLTNNVNVLHDAIDDLEAAGMTAGHLGVAWAWYLISPEWASVLPEDSAPTSYDDEEVRKVAILMTDGMFNSTYVGGNGSSVNQAKALCDNMKADGVTIFTVGFLVPEEVVPTLQYCATSPKHWYPAEDGAALRQTFRDIANRLNGLRLAS